MFLPRPTLMRPCVSVMQDGHKPDNAEWGFWRFLDFFHTSESLILIFQATLAVEGTAGEGCTGFAVLHGF